MHISRSSSNIASRAARSPRQGPRRLRPGPATAAREHRSPQRLRLGLADWHPRQGPRADADFGLLVRSAGRRESPDHDRRAEDVRCRTAVDCRQLEGRTTLCRKTRVVPIECVVRGYLSGSGWAEYRKSRHRLRHPAAGRPAGKLAAAGADLHARHQSRNGPRREHHLRADGRGGGPRVERRTAAAKHRHLPARRRSTPCERGIIIADTKFEFGQVDGEILLIDEVLTPDSSRFWPADQYAPGRGQPSLRQAVRPRLADGQRLGQEQPPPALPDDVVEKTRAKYVEAYEQLTGWMFG